MPDESGSHCGTIGSESCWCDELCVGYGDCCADAADECGVDECDEDSDCGPGLQCAEVDGAMDCAPACGRVGAATVTCPAGWRLAPNHAGMAFCLEENLTASQAAAGCAAMQVPSYAEPYCHYTQSGYYGYAWDVCPEGTTADVGPGGEQLCTVSPAALPVHAVPYCHYVEDGYFGFHWTKADDPTYTCPAGMRLSSNNAGTLFCLMDIAAIPGPVEPACASDASTVGFAWLPSCE